MQTFDISIALGVHYQQTVNSTLGSYGLRKVASTLWNGEAKDNRLYSAYVCKLLACQNLKGIISIIGAPNTVKVLSACFW